MFIWLPSIIVNSLLLSIYPKSDFYGFSGAMLLMEHLLMSAVLLAVMITIWQWSILSAFYQSLSKLMKFKVTLIKALMVIVFLYTITIYLVWICWKLKIDIFNLNDLKVTLSNQIIHDLNIFLNIFSISVLFLFNIITAKVLRTLEKGRNSFIYEYFGVLILLLFSFLGGCVMVQNRISSISQKINNLPII
jgi:hypothetical protein